MICARCGHKESEHQAPSLFAPGTPCRAKFWATGELDCKCEEYISVEAAERAAIAEEGE